MLLECDSIKERLFAAMKVLNREINLQHLKADIRNKTREDLDEQQRNYFLQQQIKNLQAEMGGESAPEKNELMKKAEAHIPNPVQFTKTYSEQVPTCGYTIKAGFAGPGAATINGCSTDAGGGDGGGAASAASGGAEG